MLYARRLAILRLCCAAALVVSAALTVEHLQGGPTFCPLEEACERARQSALGSIGGVPTSIVGLGAFSAFFLVTLLPLGAARFLSKPAGALAFLGGTTFIAYQAVKLGSFCPLCIVADSAAVIAGLAAFTWPRLPVRPSGRALPSETVSSRLAWGFATCLAVALPFAWPRAAAPAWETVPASAHAALARAIAAEDPPAPRAAAAATTTADPAPTDPDAPPAPTPEPVTTPLPAGPVASSEPPPGPVAASFPPEAPSEGPGVTPPTDPPPTAPSSRSPARAPSAPAGPDAAPASESPAHPAGAPEGPASRARTGDAGEGAEEQAHPEGDAQRSARPPHPGSSSEGPVPPAKEAPLVVEYVNAWCPHCRATHARLERVLAQRHLHVRRVRIYAWATRNVPLWARALAYAQTVGAESRLFDELTHAAADTPAEIYAAARRAGLDLAALQAAVRQPVLPPRLVRDRELVRAAGLRALPTLDIGRRRLIGEQSEASLSAALDAAIASGS